MKSSEIRETFLKYFEKNGHERVKSASLVPANDPTLFFTNAGMVQFKDVFTGAEARPYKRACSSQKCMRVSGKHNDLENVGHTPRHHTFFEMLGNFSFGDYFKKDAIAFSWEFLTKQMGLDGKKMYVTVFREDDEAEKLWLKHVSKEKIFRLDEKDNFWAMGDTGPCGPCSEILWDFGSGPVKKEDLDSDRFMEIWNLVFMQFERFANGEMKPLARPSIDTGMGLERLSAVMEGVKSNWETDLFVPIITKAGEILGHKPHESADVDIALRVIADHIRGSVFLIGDGVLPSNEGRGYVLRRIMRRAIRYGKRLGRDNPFLSKLVSVVVDEMGSAYPELVTHEKFIEKVVTAEEERFYATLGKGLDLLMDEIRGTKSKVISGSVAFKLYDTFGFPLDVTQMIAAENNFSVDEKGFESEMSKQRERARASWKGSGEESVSGVFKQIAQKGIKSEFVGYEHETAEASILAIIEKGMMVDSAKEGSDVEFITDVTPFYGESGGQVGDVGLCVAAGLEVEVVATKRPLPNLISHQAKVKRGTLKEGLKVVLAIDDERRSDTRANHTATHLLHKALREVLGEHVKQAGSLVEAGRLRFDFSHFQAMTKDEIREVERNVNDAIRKNFQVTTRELSYDEAVKEGALAFFGEKYGDRVRMIDISGFSRELCGGTHVKATGDIGMLKIISESSVAAGVRRIEAVTGRSAAEFIEDLEDEILGLSQFLKVGPGEIKGRVEKLVGEISRLEREVKKARSQGAESAGDILSQAKDINGMKVLAVRVDAPDRTVQSEWAEKYRDKLGNSVIVLISTIDEKVSIVVAVAKSLTPKVHAGKIVQALSEVVGGKGGGRPDFAQGGGSDVSKIEEALGKVKQLVR